MYSLSSGGVDQIDRRRRYHAATAAYEHTEGLRPVLPMEMPVTCEAPRDDSIQRSDGINS